MKSLFSELFAYNLDCNKRLITAFLTAGENVPDKSKKLFHHILTAHHVWNARLSGIASEYGVWEAIPAGLVEKVNEENHILTGKILRQRDLSEIIDYKNSKGASYSNNIRNILFHVVNHSTYHRGQIAMNFRDSGLEPLVTDFIFYKR